MQHHRILIADDELDVQMLLCLFFERLGYSIIRARDGHEAVTAAASQLPDLILMDIQMPRKTGVEAAQELRADPRFAGTPIIAITAHARSFLPSDILRAGFDQIIFKPFDFAEVEARIGQAMRRDTAHIHAG
jgi:two-component system, OmpR family, response regulator AdeR